MQSFNRVILTAAGGGKTTRIAEEAAKSATRSAILTYTQNNVAEIERKFLLVHGHVPSYVEIFSWFTFLLRELARPYRGVIYDKRIDEIAWVKGQSKTFSGASNVQHFYFAEPGVIYSDKLARFICDCDVRSGGAIVNRLLRRFEQIYIDEVQDLAGYDLNILELLLRSKMRVTLVGDPRQGTFRTNFNPKNARYAQYGIGAKFREWARDRLLTIIEIRETHRCNQAIADFADALFPDEPKTISLNRETTNHDGVFWIPTALVESYFSRWHPQVLRLDKTTSCAGLDTMNFGASKGMTFERVLIFPHKKAQEWLSTGDIKHVKGSAAKMYVGLTRARSSVVFAFDGKVRIGGIQRIPDTAL